MRARRGSCLLTKIRLRQALDDREGRIRGERESANRWRAERGYELLPKMQMEAFADHLKPLALLSLHTGMCRGELFALTWPSVDLEAGRITVHGATAKSGRTRHLPLNSEAFAVLSAGGTNSPKPRLSSFFLGSGPINRIPTQRIF
jgi:integrase